MGPIHNNHAICLHKNIKLLLAKQETYKNQNKLSTFLFQLNNRRLLYVSLIYDVGPIDNDHTLSFLIKILNNIAEKKDIQQPYIKSSGDTTL